MRYGMPHSGGFGPAPQRGIFDMGVDRLVMSFTDQHSIREALLFPALRKEEQGESNKHYPQRAKSKGLRTQGSSKGSAKLRCSADG